MTPPTFKLAEQGEYLSSRHVASSLRERILRAGGPVVVDLSGVESLSDSFADELFAVLVQDHGHDWFAATVSVIGLSQPIRQTILRAVHLRCESQVA
jgi:anti-anti-sigma regulatory factor